MNNNLVGFIIIAMIVLLYLCKEDELKVRYIIPTSYNRYIPSQEGSSRGGVLMHVFSNLSGSGKDYYEK
tara:strand:- start:290 stop:496 length:207 start_codon:yes stop_codon:yes gene_type:complete